MPGCSVRFLSQVVIDTKDLRFLKGSGERLIQLERRVEVITDGLFDYQARTFPIGRQPPMDDKIGDFPE